MKRGFIIIACQTHRSMYPSIFNRLRAIARYWSEIATFSYLLAFSAPVGGDPLGRSSWFLEGELLDGQATIWCKNIPEKLTPWVGCSGARTSQTTDGFAMPLAKRSHVWLKTNQVKNITLCSLTPKCIQTLYDDGGGRGPCHHYIPIFGSHQ